MNWVMEDRRRCRICGRRMLLWRWRWAHRRCVRTHPSQRTEVDAHPWQEYNAHGNTCHYPGCQLSEDEHTRRNP